MGFNDGRKITMMKNQISKHLFLFAFLSITNSLLAQSLSQQVIGNSGGVSIHQEAGNLHWTIGEAIVEIIGSDDEFYLAQGFHQLYHDLLFTDLENIVEDTENILLYPNPSTGAVFLQFDKHKPKSIAVSNQIGQILLHYDNYEKGDKIDLSALPNGVYFLSVLQQNQFTKTFKVIKV